MKSKTVYTSEDLIYARTRIDQNEDENMKNNDTLEPVPLRACGGEPLDLQDCMNQILIRLGLRGWTVHWDPDLTQTIRRQVFPDARIILIHDDEPSEALKTLLQEILEVKIRPLLGVYRETINQLIALLEKMAYKEKERLLDELAPYLRQAVREGAPSATHPEQGETR